MRVYPLGCLVILLGVTQILAADSLTTNAGLTTLVSSPQYREFMTTAATSKYAVVVGRAFENWGTNVLGPSFVCKETIVDKSGIANGIGPIRVVDKFFVTSGSDTNNRCYVRVKYYECSSANAVRSYFLTYVAPIYAAGPPPINKTYNAGDVVLTSLDRDKVVNHACFVVFFNNTAVECNISAEGSNARIDMPTILMSMENWARGNPK